MNIERDQIAEVLDVERAWVAAHRCLDFEVLSRILSDEYRQIQSDGNVIGKDELYQLQNKKTFAYIKQ